jgi:tetratricopeptide (TPR) repeat protein
MARALVLLATLALAASARAQAGDDALTRARGHFEVGQGLYRLGEYRGALKEFAAGYELSPRPQFLINMGQAYRRLGELERARELFLKFLLEAPPADPERAAVQELVVEVTRAIERAPPPPGETATAIVPAAHAPVVTSEQPPQRRTRLRHLYWAIPLGLVVGVGLGVGLYFGLRPPAQVACGSADIGCLELKGR